jgi:hypothetical protein
MTGERKLLNKPAPARQSLRPKSFQTTSGVGNVRIEAVKAVGTALAAHSLSKSVVGLRGLSAGVYTI